MIDPVWLAVLVTRLLRLFTPNWSVCFELIFQSTLPSVRYSVFTLDAVETNATAQGTPVAPPKVAPFPPGTATPVSPLFLPQPSFPVPSCSCPDPLVTGTARPIP